MLKLSSASFEAVFHLSSLAILLSVELVEGAAAWERYDSEDYNFLYRYTTLVATRRNRPRVQVLYQRERYQVTGLLLIFWLFLSVEAHAHEAGIACHAKT